MGFTYSGLRLTLIRTFFLITISRFLESLRTHLHKTLVITFFFSKIKLHVVGKLHKLKNVYLCTYKNALRHKYANRGLLDSVKKCLYYTVLYWTSKSAGLKQGVASGGPIPILVFARYRRPDERVSRRNFIRCC